MFPQPKFKTATSAVPVYVAGDAVYVIDRDDNKQYLAEVRAVSPATCDVVLWSPEASGYASDVFEIKREDLSKTEWANIPVANNLTKAVASSTGPVVSNQTVQDALLLPRGFDAGIPADIPAGASMVVQFPGFNGYVRIGVIKKFPDGIVRGDLLTDAGQRSGVWAPIQGDGAMARPVLQPGYCDRRVDDAARSAPVSAGGVIVEGAIPPNLATIDPPAVPTAGDPQINTPVADLEATKLAQAEAAAATLLSGAKDAATHPVAAGAAETVKKGRGRPRKETTAVAPAGGTLSGTVSAAPGMTLVLSAQPAVSSGATAQSATTPAAPSSVGLIKAHLSNLKAAFANQAAVLTALQKQVDEIERLIS